MRAVRKLIVVFAVIIGSFAVPVTAWAHPHEASPAHHGDGQTIANVQNHGPFTTTTSGHGLTCGGDPAAYGLETAHHGPDAGDSGKADGCYETDSMPPGSDDSNPALD